MTLRPLSLAARPTIRRWLRNPDIVRFTVVVPGPAYAQATAYGPVEADHYLDALLHDPARRSFGIHVAGAHVGNVGLRDVCLERKTAECFIEIGETPLHGRGIGGAAMRLLMDYAFGELSLDSLSLGVFEFNAPAIRLYERAGFRPCGRYGLHWAEGRYWEVVRMACTRAYWRKAATPQGVQFATGCRCAAVDPPGK